MTLVQWIGAIGGTIIALGVIWLSVYFSKRKKRREEIW